MRIERKRRGRSTSEVLRTVSNGILWGAAEIHILRDKFILETKASPPTAMKSLEDLLKTASLVDVRMTGAPAVDIYNVFNLCTTKNLFFTRLFTRSRKTLFAWIGVPQATHAWGVPVVEDLSVPDDGVLFGLSRVPFGDLGSIHILLKGDTDVGEG